MRKQTFLSFTDNESNFIYFHVETDKPKESLRGKIKFIPLVDDDFHIVDIANAKTHTIQFRTSFKR